MSNDKKNTEVKEVESLDDKIAKAVGKAIEEALPVAVMAVSKVTNEAKAPQVVIQNGRPPPKEFGSRCHECGQYLIACKGEHEQLIVAPANPRRFKSFPGVTINGLTYLSPNLSTPVTVPKANDIRTAIRLWEEGEDDMQMGRVVNHNSGTLSGVAGGAGVPFAGAGFRG